MNVAVMFGEFEEVPVLVAIVNAGELEGDQALEFAFEKTQNINYSWTEGKSVKLVGYRDNARLRSTAVGDYFVAGDGVYKVAAFGFDKIATRDEVFTNETIAV
jgi:hypothetical protein